MNHTDQAWKAERYDYLVGNDGNPEWQLERDNIYLREQLEEARKALRTLVFQYEAHFEAFHPQYLTDIGPPPGVLSALNTLNERRAR